MAAVEIGFDGYAIGGVSVGEPEEEMMLAVWRSSAPFYRKINRAMPWDWARHRNYSS